MKRGYHLYQATKAHDKGDYKTAIIKYKEVLEISPESDNVLYNLGVAYANNNQIKEAREQIEKLKKFEHQDYADLLQEIVDKAADRAAAK